MIKAINRLLVKYSKLPYRTVILKTGLKVDHYRDGRIVCL
jgi:hypothetical protein